MALFHFVNCSLTAFTPYYIIYDGFKLSKNAGWTKLFFLVCFYYIVSQILKLFALAFFSIGLLQNMNLFNIIFQECANFIDLAGLYYILSHKHTNTINLKERILSVGLSWGFCESMATNFFPFFIGGRSMDFSLKHIYRSISANTFMFSNLSKTCLLFMWLKNTQSRKKINVVNFLLLYFTFILPLVNKIILIHEGSFNKGIIIHLIVLLVCTFVLSFATKCIFNSKSNANVESYKESHTRSYEKNDGNDDDGDGEMNKDQKKKIKKKKRFFYK
ncbi:hypothetical protein PCYB_081630 [Plasmodium cynomolgi strain B]|uniref:BOS complex subunit TMEM147 n=1 Tax=Plasmodium cynomolgi (strain B) TaxID=1120755 RepID=K6VA22_PLACD|nr:hypothetical protein PCYB_081630 [Plasmodium cynomolgi strain B]GAB66002.1 hypothetical protein PCYB_081630 [Plasmodium cynomolgi strain B]